MDYPSSQRVKSGAGIRLHQVSKSYGSTSVIPELSVELLPGEFTVILGPSGCGKSTLLQMIAGLESVSSGSILIADREVQRLEPKQRGCAMVFQNYALYPHMTVFDNIAYSLRIAGVSRPERQHRVAKVAEMLGLSAYLARRPSQLSGGQRQRVAIGRAIVREPQVLLFDEPLSNLDAKLRHEMRIELADLHRRIGATSLFVTHDQTEAMTLADRILILNQGRIEQFATPQEIYHRPATVFVARFVGSPAMNLIPVEGDGNALRSAAGEILAHSQLMGKFLLGIRPEDILMAAPATELPGVSARFRYREEMGSHAVLMAELGCGTPLQITTPFGDTRWVLPDYLTLYFPAHRLHLFDAQSGLVIPDSFITE